jgi:hypothetical protein
MILNFIEIIIDKTIDSTKLNTANVRQYQYIHIDLSLVSINYNNIYVFIITIDKFYYVKIIKLGLYIIKEGLCDSIAEQIKKFQSTNIDDINIDIITHGIIKDEISKTNKNFFNKILKKLKIRI